jgi:hypothetical protein
MNPQEVLYQTIFLQNTFEYCDTLECFQKFRLVSKAWKFAIETKRFSHPNSDDSHSNSILTKVADRHPSGKYPLIYHKILNSLKCLNLSLRASTFDSMSNLILNNMKRLTSINVSNNYDLFEYFWKNPSKYETFLSNVLLNSNITLKKVYLPKVFLPNLHFKNLSKFTMLLWPEFEKISLSEFQTQFSQMVKNSPSLELVELYCSPNVPTSFYDFLTSNYKKHLMISSWALTVPVKIAKGICAWEDIENFEFKNDLQYIELGLSTDSLSQPSWKNYENIFCECQNLKGIKFADWICISHRPVVNHEIEVERRNFLQSLGIEILTRDEFHLKEQELFKSVSWRLEIDINTTYEY